MNWYFVLAGVCWFLSGLCFFIGHATKTEDVLVEDFWLMLISGIMGPCILLLYIAINDTFQKKVLFKKRIKNV